MAKTVVLAAVLIAGCTGGFNFHSGGSTTSSSGTPSSSGGGGGGGGGGLLGGGSKPYAATATSTPDAWKHYELKGVTLGTPRKVLVDRGFTCGKRTNSRCYTIVDDRCKKSGARCVVKEDAFDQWFELNGAKTSLEYISCATTESDSALVYSCVYQFPRQVLAPDQGVGKALIAKYGEPTHTDEPDRGDKVGGGRMNWSNEELGSNAPELSVDCTGADHGDGNGPTGAMCTVQLDDYAISKNERERQLDIDDKRKRQAPATAPSL